MLFVSVVITFWYYIFCKLAFIETKLMLVKEKKIFSELTSYAGLENFTFNLKKKNKKKKKTQFSNYFCVVVKK
ncbi:hypothetical protein J8855_25450, partial [Klebsiella pneumoniae]